MDVRANLAPHATDAPKLAIEAESRGFRWAFAAAILLHLLLPVVVYRANVPRAELSAAAVEGVPNRAPTPVKVVFYQEPRALATPPPNTAELSDQASRAKSAVAPLVKSESRLPAAPGHSRERQPEQPAAPAAPPAAAPPIPRPQAVDLPDSAAMIERARVARAQAAAHETTLQQPAAPSFDDRAIASAYHQQPGYGHTGSGVSETGAMSFDAKDFEWGPYARKVYEVVNRNWKTVIPLAARTPGVNGVVKLRFRILRGGRVEQLELLESSGRAALDQASLASIELSDPLPPLPEAFPRDEVGVTFSYYYNVAPE